MLVGDVRLFFAQLEYYDVRLKNVFCMIVLSHNNYTHMQRSRDMTRMEHIYYARAYILRRARHTYRYTRHKVAHKHIKSTSTYDNRQTIRYYIVIMALPYLTIGIV